MGTICQKMVAQRLAAAGTVEGLLRVESECGGGRLRKTTIVALARKLLVALWKYVTAGVVIEGATMKVA
jgi:hypothetical protein